MQMYRMFGSESGVSACVLVGEAVDGFLAFWSASPVVNAHGSAEFRLLPGAGHRRRHGPRAIAILLGWLDRMRSMQTHPSAKIG
ncbi:MAG: hypothetical protein P8O03_01730 [Ilumatobacter sp.]|nr:hypothetical protein [Ilumatobacter sp.]